MENNITEGIDAFIEKRRKEDEEIRKKMSYNFGSSFSTLIGCGLSVLLMKIFLPDYLLLVEKIVSKDSWLIMPFFFLFVAGVLASVSAISFSIWRYFLWRKK